MLWLQEIAVAVRRLMLWLQEIAVADRRLMLWLQEIAVADRRLMLWLTIIVDVADKKVDVITEWSFKFPTVVVC
jgi:hypothetical protein